MRRGPSTLAHSGLAGALGNEVSFGTQGLEPYERLLYDAMLGDRTLFTDAEGIESLWAASSALVEDPPPLHRYTPGSYGPQKMHELIAPRRWWLPEP